jgi:phosphoglucosamine mutase
MKRKYFGTDGIRGTVNSSVMTAETAMRVGMAAGRYFHRGDHRHRVVIGKDTRLSGYMIEPALVAGFVAVGMDVITVGPMPTPAVAMLTKSMRADLGVMISASHNPYHDNGIKMFGPDGYKLSDGTETKIERMIDNALESTMVDPAQTGRAKRLEDVAGRYVEFVKSTVPSGFNFEGKRIVLDCANGAGYMVAPLVLWELGADVISVGTSPNGFNINSGCGSTSPELLAEQVVTHNADLGIALDGDADRVLLVDEKGSAVDGDQLMGLVTRYWHQKNLLKGGGLVATVMSNLGLENFVNGLGLNMCRTKVGDRYVVEKMRQSGYNLGGEKSGHIVLSDYSTTGDGLLAALQVLRVLSETDRPASEMLRVFEPMPQVLRSVIFQAEGIMEHKNVVAAIREGEALLKGRGRLLIRKSGTEPVIRVMAEGDDEVLIHEIVNEICSVMDNAA